MRKGNGPRRAVELVELHLEEEGHVAAQDGGAGASPCMRLAVDPSSSLKRACQSTVARRARLFHRIVIVCTLAFDVLLERDRVHIVCVCVLHTHTHTHIHIPRLWYLTMLTITKSAMAPVEKMAEGGATTRVGGGAVRGHVAKARDSCWCCPEKIRVVVYCR